MKNKKDKSNCCNATVSVIGKTTKYYQCNKCLHPCNKCLHFCCDQKKMVEDIENGLEVWSLSVVAFGITGIIIWGIISLF